MYPTMPLSGPPGFQKGQISLAGWRFAIGGLRTASHPGCALGTVRRFHGSLPPEPWASRTPPTHGMAEKGGSEMHAAPGDRIIICAEQVDGDDRSGQVLSARHPDGSPPYWIRWDQDGHESLVYPPASAFFLRHNQEITGTAG